MSLEGRLERIRQTYQDKGLRLGAAAPLPSVKAFESKYGIRLPEEYRYFVLSLGNGGDPPFCGIFPQADHDDSDVGAQPIYFDQMRRYGFLDWLEAWLEERQLFQGFPGGVMWRA